MKEVPLAGGNVNAGIVRVGDTVRRPTGPWSPSIHALLLHLDAVGFEGAPRFLGIDDKGREILSFHPGTALIEDSTLVDRADDLAAAIAVVRAFHRAAATRTG